ncbi:MAG: hypothetical protein V1799_20540 [bacterium]
MISDEVPSVAPLLHKASTYFVVNVLAAYERSGFQVGVLMQGVKQRTIALLCN